jgi:hypothetical protein
MQVKCPFLSVQYLYTGRDSALNQLIFTVLSTDFIQSTALYFGSCARVVSSANPQICHGVILPFLNVL